MNINEYKIKPGANLEDANLVGANLEGASFEGANVKGTILAPIGIEPEFIWKKKRLHDLLAEVRRYKDAGRKAKAEWFSEIDKLIDDLGH